MPNIAAFHPQIVHFVVALLIIGVGARILSLFGWPKFASGAATTLIILGTVAAILAVQSGTQAHGPVERIPGTRPVVQEHEEGGERTRNIFIGVTILELIAVTLGRGGARQGAVRGLHLASAVVGLVGCVILFDTAREGGELVYSYAGGPGLRTNDTADVSRLLLAGLYNQSRVDRREKRFADAADLVSQMRRRFPNDTNVRILYVESLQLDQKNYPAALAALDSIQVAPNDARLRPRLATMRADIFLAMNQPDSAKASLAPVVQAFPQNPRLKAKLDSIK